MSTSTSAQEVGAMRANMASQVPNEVWDIFEREQSTLATLGDPAGFLPVGSMLPDVELNGPDGVPTSRGEATGDSPSVVVFYPGKRIPIEVTRSDGSIKELE